MPRWDFMIMSTIVMYIKILFIRPKRWEYIVSLIRIRPATHRVECPDQLVRRRENLLNPRLEPSENGCHHQSKLRVRTYRSVIRMVYILRFRCWCSNWIYFKYTTHDAEFGLEAAVGKNIVETFLDAKTKVENTHSDDFNASVTYPSTIDQHLSLAMYY